MVNSNIDDSRDKVGHFWFGFDLTLDLDVFDIYQISWLMCELKLPFH